MPQLRLEQFGPSKKSFFSFVRGEMCGKDLDDTIFFTLLMPAEVNATSRTLREQSGNSIRADLPKFYVCHVLLSSPVCERMFVSNEEYYTMWEKGVLALLPPLLKGLMSL